MQLNSSVRIIIIIKCLIININLKIKCRISIIIILIFKRELPDLFKCIVYTCILINISLFISVKLGLHAGVAQDEEDEETADDASDSWGVKRSALEMESNWLTKNVYVF